MAKTLHVTGFAELEKRFRALPDKFQRKTATRMTRAAATVVRDDARVTTLFKDRTGALRRNITIRKSKKNQDRDKVIYIIGVEHGKTREVVNGKVTYKNRWGKVVTRRATKREKRGEDPFYWRFVELGFTAVGTKRDGSGHKVAGKRFLTQALPEASQEAIRAMQNAFNDSIRQGELTGP